MSDEARSMWEKFITAPENRALLKRYAKSAKEPAPLFESIGEDLASSNEERRESAWWALVAAMPELTNILHERETRQPGMNRSSDILSYLHRVLVKEHRFKISGGYGKDPRPFMNTAISNRKRDEERRRRNRDDTLREVLLDYEAVLKLPDPSSSIEDRVLEDTAYEECKRELCRWGYFRSDDDLDLFEAVYVDENPLGETLKRFGIRKKNTLLQRISRARKNIVAARNAMFTYLLSMKREFLGWEKLALFPLDPEKSEWWAERAKRMDLHNVPAYIYLALSFPVPMTAGLRCPLTKCSLCMVDKKRESLPLKVYRLRG